MKSLVIRSDSQVFVVPEFTLRHAGFIGDGPGHTDFRNSSGSFFKPGVGPDIFERLLSLPGLRAEGAVLEADAMTPIGHSALAFGAEPSGVVFKEETPRGSRQTSLVLAPAFLDPDVLSNSATTLVSAIAPPTSDASFLPSDVADDPEVLSALSEGRLRTFVSVFPGASFVDGKPLSRVSEFPSNVSFRLHPENSNYAPLPLVDIPAFCSFFNERSLRENLPAPAGASERAAVVAAALRDFSAFSMTSRRSERRADDVDGAERFGNRRLGLAP